MPVQNRKQSFAVIVAIAAVCQFTQNQSSISCGFVVQLALSSLCRVLQFQSTYLRYGTAVLLMGVNRKPYIGCQLFAAVVRIAQSVES